MAFLKTLGGVIDEALKRGHSVSLLYDLQEVGTYQKGMRGPDPAYFPSFFYGKPIPTSFDGVQDFSRAVQDSVDILVLHCGFHSRYPGLVSDKNTLPGQYQLIRKSGIPVVSLFSYFYENCLHSDALYHFFDKVCVLSEYAKTTHRKMLLENFGRSEAEVDALFKEKLVVTGSAMFDPIDAYYRQHHGHSSKEKAVLFVAQEDDQPYTKMIMSRRYRWIDFLYLLFFHQGRHLSEVFSVPRYADFLEKLGQFIKKNHLELWVKSRPKNGRKFDDFLTKMASYYVFGDSEVYYPESDSFRFLQGAGLSVSLRSYAVLEAVVAGVPAIHTAVPVFDPTFTLKVYSDAVEHGNPDSVFNFDGCVWSVPWSQVASFLDEVDFSRLQQDPARRQKYVQYFCGVEEESAASRQMTVIESML